MATGKKKGFDRANLDRLYDAKHNAEVERNNATDESQRRAAQERIDKATAEIDKAVGADDEEG